MTRTRHSADVILALQDELQRLYDELETDPRIRKMRAIRVLLRDYEADDKPKEITQ